MLEELRAELRARTERDQAVRTAAGLDPAKMAAIDADNTAWLKQVVAEHGWPGRSLVGSDGANDAWLLVQHADADPAFQRQCLDLMTAAEAKGEVSDQNVAYLTDRVLLAEGEQQVYGTQTWPRDGRYEARRLRDPAGVDQRRAAVGLGPLAEYLAEISAAYGPPDPVRMACHDCGAEIEFWPPDDGSKQEVTCGACGASVTIQMT